MTRLRVDTLIYNVGMVLSSVAVAVAIPVGLVVCAMLVVGLL